MVGTQKGYTSQSGTESCAKERELRKCRVIAAKNWRIGSSKWHHQTFCLGEFLLVPIESKKPLSLQNKCRCNMQDIKTAMSSHERVRDREPFGFINHIRKVTDFDLNPSTGPISLKLRPEQRRLALFDPFAKLSEAESVSQLILTQGSEGKSPSLGLHPSYRPGRVSIVPV
jgi:hypothetical protein